MKSGALDRALILAGEVKHIFVATADVHGWPHVAAAGRIALTPENHVLVSEWFCPGTVANLHVNPRLSIVVWDANRDAGYQIVGELEEIRDLGMLDGFAPSVEGKRRFPQVERQLLVHVDRIIEFKRSPHTDVED
ncbi:MAG: pyridoxamine 5'-phosphate oxidase family protein [Dehalococcoidia bacterium]|nr:pyridoxamine 5'-phosphate oxidase family protein [Dehalococcoidia bacterium]